MAQERTLFFPVGLDFATIIDMVGQPAMGSFEGAYIDAENGHLYAGKNGRGAGFRPLDGMLEIPWDAPASGTNTGMGAFWDERGDTAIFFVMNPDSDGGDSIVRYYPKTGQTDTIRIDLGLQPNKPVTGCVLINAELLVFTDDATYPKCIDLPRAGNLEKKSVVRAYLPQYVDGRGGRQFYGQLMQDGALVGSQVAFPVMATALQVRDFTPMMGMLADMWNSNTALHSQFHARGCADYVEFDSQTTGMWSVAIWTSDDLGTSMQAQQPCVVEYRNRYNDPFTLQQIRLSKIMPQSVPSAIMAVDTKRKTNNILGKQWQFARRYWFRDHSHSLCGPFSDIAMPPVVTCGSSGEAYNCIDIDIADHWLDETPMRGEIESIDIVARDGNFGAWWKVANIKKWEWMYNRTFRFRNDLSYEAVPQDQVLAASTYCPPKCSSLTAITDVDDNTRILASAPTEGDEPPTIPITLRPNFAAVAAQADLVDIIGRVIITSVFDVSLNQPYNQNQPIIVYDETVGPVYGGMGAALVGHTPDPETWGQAMPLGGWPVYCAGTDILDITTQVNIPAVFGCGSVSATPWNAPSGHAAAGRGVYDGTRDGTSVISNCNDTHRAAVRDLIQQNHVYSTFRLRGLERGRTYIIRLASNLCTRGDGTVYDIERPDRAYQGTSSYVGQVGSVSDPNIKVGRHECVVTVPLTGPSVIDIGNIVTFDTTNPLIAVGSFVISGYLRDLGGVDNSGSTILDGIPMERQLVRFMNYDNVAPGYAAFPTNTFSFLGLAVVLWPAFYPFILFTAVLDQMFGPIGDNHDFTDHNGFWFFFNRNQPSHFPRAEFYGVTGDILNPAGNYGVAGAGNVPYSNFYKVLNGFTQSKWEGDPDTVGGSVSGNLFNGPGGKSYLVANLYAGTDIRTHVTATFVNLAGDPVQGVGAWIEGGRGDVSNQDGEIDLIVYGDVEANNNDRIGDRLVLFGTGACTMQFPNGSVVPVLVPQFISGQQYSDTVPFPLGDLPATIVSTGAQRGFRRGGTYMVGYRVPRDNGDTTAVKVVATLRFPTRCENLCTYDPLLWPPANYPNGELFIDGPGVIDWTILAGVPDLWIGHVDAIQFCMTRDLSVGDDEGGFGFIQWNAAQVIYSPESASVDADSNPTATTHANGNATEIYIDVNSGFIRYAQLHSNPVGIGYLWEDGDMVRILSDRYGTPLREVVEARITAFRGSRWITIPATSSIPELFGGELVEVFRPSKPADGAVQTFYDIPGGLVTVTDPYGTPAWSLTSGTLDKGTIWRLPTMVPIHPDTASVSPGTPWRTIRTVRDSESQSDFYASRGWGKGKPCAQDPEARVQDRGMLARYSGAYLPGTLVNNLNLFGGFDSKTIENRLGRIRVSVPMGQEIILLCENGVGAFYIGVQQSRQTAESLLEFTGAVLGNFRPMVHDLGTVDPLSVVKSDTSLFWFCRKYGAWVEWASNELQDKALKGKARPYFMQRAMNIGDGFVCGGYDAGNGEFIASFPAVTYNSQGIDGLPIIVEADAESITYHNDENKWIARMAWSPDCWGKTALEFYSFKDGKLWRHEADPANPNVLGGVQVYATITIPVNGNNPTWNKEVQTMWIGRGDGWDVPEIRTNLGGFLSIPASKITTRPDEGGIYKVDGIHNEKKLKGTAWSFKLRHGAGRFNLLWVNFGWTPHGDTGAPNQ